MVDFEVFRDQYWPTFPNNLRKGMSRTLVFMEIIGVIKGSACHSIDFSPLTREGYFTDGRRISRIDVDRNQVYDIYQHYERTKREYGDVDDVDRARGVLQGMAKNPDVRMRIERAFDEIYVDGKKLPFNDLIRQYMLISNRGARSKTARTHDAASSDQDPECHPLW